jgi:hypothetical protein
MCCLKYEQEAYEDLLRRSPKEESFVDTPEGRGTVMEVSLLRQRVKVRMEQDPETISVFSVEEIAVLRNGKAKKNDPPIPADLAPISGNGKRVRKEKKEEESAFLNPIKFRYREEAVVEEKPQPESEDAPESRRRRGRGGKPRQEDRPETREKPEGKKPEEKPEGKKPKKPEVKKPAEGQPQSEGADQPAGEPKANKRPYHHRRPNYHHRRKPKAGPPAGGE